MQKILKSKNTQAVLNILLIFAIACILVLLSDGSFAGLSSMEKSNVLYRAWKQDSFFHVYDRHSFNGSAVFQHSSWVSSAVSALIEEVNGGNAQNACMASAVLALASGGSAWYFTGRKEGRAFYGLMLGILWMLMPFIACASGDLSLLWALCIFPWLLYFLEDWIHSGNRKKLAGIWVFSLLIILMNPKAAFLEICAVCLLLLFFCIFNGYWARVWTAVLCMALAAGTVCIWLLPYLRGIDFFSKSASSASVQNLNPFLQDHLYAGIGLFIVIILGCFGAGRNALPDFLSAAVISVFSFLPMHMPYLSEQDAYACMFSMVCVYCLHGLLLWKTSRKELMASACVLLLMDAVLPREQKMYQMMTGTASRKEEKTSALIAEAEKITSQRISVIDGRNDDALHYELLESCSETRGFEEENAITRSNFSLLDIAANDGYYKYLFSRTKLSGSDTVLVRKGMLHEYRLDQNGEQMDSRKNQHIAMEAQDAGYQLKEEDEEWLLFHMDVPAEQWGTITKWNSIGIGTDANVFALAYPDMEETCDADLNHYKYEQLSRYHTVFLDGFTYEDRAQAEQLVEQLSEHGTRIVILGDGIPYDRQARARIFLGVNTNSISFENGYPEMESRKYGTLDLDLFPRGYQNWHTCYLNDLDKVDAVIEDNDLSLAFYGTKGNSNIVFLGLNLPYYYCLTQDENAGKILQDAYGTEAEQLPEMKTTDLKISYGKNQIRIESEEDNVNTSIAYLDSFASDQVIKNSNHYLTVSKGTTIISWKEPYWIASLMITTASLILTFLVLHAGVHGKKKDE